MKFDSKLYELTKDVNKEEEYTKEELEIAEFILNEFCKKAKEEKSEDGIITVTFTSRWWGTVDNGYHEIYNLFKSKKFNTLFRHYNIYIGDLSFVEDEFNNAYFELKWDYMTYIDGLKNNEKKKEIKTYEENKRLNEYKKNCEEVAIIEEEIKALQRKLEIIKKR